MLEIGIHPDGRRPALIIDNALLPDIQDAATAALNEAIRQGLPQPPVIDRQPEAHASATVEKTRLALEERAAAKRAALAAGDFAALAKTELALERSQQEHARAERLAAEIAKDIDARQAEANVNRAAAGRAARRTLAKDLDSKIKEALAAFLELAGAQLKAILITHRQRQLLDAHLSSDAVAESIYDGQQAARNGQANIGSKEILAISPQVPLKCEKCHGPICVSGKQVRCERCGRIQVDHPLTQGWKQAVA